MHGFRSSNTYKINALLILIFHNMQEKLMSKLTWQYKVHWSSYNYKYNKKNDLCESPLPLVVEDWVRSADPKTENF